LLWRGVTACWSKVILAALQKNLVFGGPGVVNNDYEGEISGPGNVVHITQFGDPSITAYTPNSTITYQTLNDAGLDLNIDQAYSFSFSVDDVDRRQAAGDMQSYLEERASYKLADNADQYIAGLYTGVASNNIVSNSLTSGSYLAPLTYSSATSHPADFYTQVLLPLKVKLSQANIPMQGRYVVVPPWAEALLEQTQAFLAVTDMRGEASQVFQTGMIGRAAGFDIYVSNNAVEFDTTGQGTWAVMAGHPMALTYAEQIVQTEALRLQTTFADGVRGLHVFGAKLVRPDAIAVAGVTRPSGI
jgi:P22 coat protein - gene protein 5